VALHSKPANAQLLHRRQQLEGKGVVHPVLRDDGRDLGLDERAHPLHRRELFSAQSFIDLVEVAVRRRQRLWLRFLHACWCIRLLRLSFRSCCCFARRCHLHSSSVASGMISFYLSLLRPLHRFSPVTTL